MSCPSSTLLDAFFGRWRGRIEWVRPRGGTIGFPRLIGDVSIERFGEELVREAGVLLAPGGLFGDEDNHFRLGFGRSNLPAALARFEAFAELKLGQSRSR